MTIFLMTVGVPAVLAFVVVLLREDVEASPVLLRRVAFLVVVFLVVVVVLESFEAGVVFLAFDAVVPFAVVLESCIASCSRLSWIPLRTSAMEGAADVRGLVSFLSFCAWARRCASCCCCRCRWSCCCCCCRRRISSLACWEALIDPLVLPASPACRFFCSIKCTK